MLQIDRESIDKVKVATIIGSTRFEDEMYEKARFIQSLGDLSLITTITKKPSFHVSEYDLMNEGYKRIDISDYVVCINKDGYIGDNTAKEYYYSTLVSRVPVYFDCDKVTEKMIGYINAFFIDNDGHCHLWNDNLIDMLGIKAICVRDQLKISNDVLYILEQECYDHEAVKHIFISDLRRQCEKYCINVRLFLDNTFESMLRESELFVPDNIEEIVESENE